MKIIKKIISIFCFLIFGIQFCFATDTRVGTTGAQFLKIGVGGRPMGMGGAYAAVSDDVNALYVNPAGLSQLENFQAQAQHIEWFQEIRYESLAGAVPVTDNLAVGVAISYQNSGNMEKRSGDTDAPDSLYDADDKLLNVGASHKITDELSLGANAKYIELTLDDKTAKTWAADVGALYKVDDKLSLGACVQNMGEGVKFVTETDPLPLNFKWGVAYKMLDDKLLLAFDTNHPNDNYMNSVVGAEYKIDFEGDIDLPVRVGYKTLNDFDTIDAFSAGVGIEFKEKMSLDIAWIPYGDLGDTYRVSLLVEFE